MIHSVRRNKVESRSHIVSGSPIFDLVGSSQVLSGSFIKMGNAFRATASLISKRYSIPYASDKRKSLIVVTGCDSGLGYSLSLKCNELGLTVISGCLNLQSDGARALKDICHVYPLNLTDSNSVQSFADKVNELIRSDDKELHAVVNNAGVMIFGEFEWYTEEQILQQVQVNMMGCFRMAKAFLPLLRKNKGRMINVTSHCALSNLPTLTVYGATKVAIQYWTDGLRMEQQKYGVKVISFIPGSFATHSNIMLNQESHSKAMEKAFSDDDHKFFGRYFKEFNLYLSHVSGPKKPLEPINDEKLYEKFFHALLSKTPRITYKHEPWRYFFYYNTFRFAPVWLKDYLVHRFLKFPKFKPS